ncbi:MAG: hypothetical protein WBM13_11895 [Bacteroidia bacterium]
MKLKLKITLVSIGILIFSFSFAQDSSMVRKKKPKPDFMDKLFWGGNFGLQFGTASFVELSPLVGYKVTPKFSLGVGVTYQYYSFKDRFYNFETNVFGGRVFSRYLFTDYLFAHAEYEYLNLEAFDFATPRRVDVTSILAGGGYVQRIGPNAAITGLLLYNFTESYYTPYTNPIIRIGVNLGF